MGLSAEDWGISEQVMEEDYLLQIAFLDPEARSAVEQSFIEPFLEVHHGSRIPAVGDYREIDGLEVKPPDVYRYFVRDNVQDIVDRNNIHDIVDSKLRTRDVVIRID